MYTGAVKLVLYYGTAVKDTRAKWNERTVGGPRDRSLLLLCQSKRIDRNVESPIFFFYDRFESLSASLNANAMRCDNSGFAHWVWSSAGETTADCKTAGRVGFGYSKKMGTKKLSLVEKTSYLQSCHHRLGTLTKPSCSMSRRST